MLHYFLVKEIKSNWYILQKMYKSSNINGRLFITWPHISAPIQHTSYNHFAQYTV